MQNYPLFLHIYFAYYFSELIGVACWVNFYFHLRSYSKLKHLSEAIVKQVKCKEYVLLIFLILLFFILSSAFLTLQAIAIFNVCSNCRPFYQFESCHGSCWSLGNVFKTIFKLLIIFGLLLIIVKIVAGVMMLYEMKKNLNFYYKEKLSNIILTMILSSLTIAWRSLYTNFVFLNRNDLKYNYAARVDKGADYIPIQIIVCVIDIFLPLAVLMYNIKTINFEKYLKNLLKGFNYKKHHSSASIFIVTYHIDTSENSEEVISEVEPVSPNIQHSPSFYESRRDSQEGSMINSEENETSYDRNLYKHSYESLRLKNKISESMLLSTFSKTDLP